MDASIRRPFYLSRALVYKCLFTGQPELVDRAPAPVSTLATGEIKSVMRRLGILIAISLIAGVEFRPIRAEPAQWGRTHVSSSNILDVSAERPPGKPRGIGGYLGGASSHFTSVYRRISKAGWRQTNASGRICRWKYGGGLCGECHAGRRFFAQAGGQKIGARSAQNEPQAHPARRVKRRNQRTLTGMGVVSATVGYLSRHSKDSIPVGKWGLATAGTASPSPA
jgi:hypothetical protein